MNVLPVERRIQILQGLLEGSSIRSISRLTGTHIVTILRLLREAGVRCAELMDEKMRGIRPEAIQCDEIWTYCKKKDARLTWNDPPEVGSQFVFVALEAQTKLIPCFLLGQRNEMTTYRFMADLRKRTVGRYQITTDAFAPYHSAVALTFGGLNVDYAQLIKSFRRNGHPKAESYSPSKFVRTKPVIFYGNPDPKKISTSYVERQNLSMRTHLRRLTRLSLGFSKKWENLWAMLAVYFCWYNLGRAHLSLGGKTPAMAAGLTDHPWTLAEIMGWETNGHLSK